MVSVSAIEPETAQSTSPPGHGMLAGGARRLGIAAAGSFSLNVANTVLNTVLAIVLARLLGVAEYGTYAFVVASVTLLAVPALMGADRLLVREVAVYARQSAFALVRGLVERAAQLTLLASLVLALLIVISAWLVAGGAVTPAVLAFWAAAAALPALSLGRVMQSGLMGLHHVVLGQFPDYVLRPALLLVLVGLGIVAIGPVLSAPVALALYAISAWAAALVAIYLLRVRRPAQMRSTPAEYRTRTWLWATVALATLSSAAIINTQAGVVMLGLLGEPDSTGLYAVAQRGALLVAFPLAAVNAAIAPTAARLWSGGDHDALRRLVTAGARGVLLASLPVALTFVVFGRPILGLLFGAEYGEADLALAIVCIGQLANAATGSVAVLLMMTSHQRQATVAIALGAVVNICAAGVLIPGLQEVGAALAATASLVVSNGLMVIVTRRSLGIDPTAVGLHPAGAK